MYDLVLFDLDGTLTQSEFGIFSSVQYALEKFGIHETDPKNLRRFIGPPLYVSFSEFYGLTGDDGELAVKYYREVYEKDGYKEAPVYDGIKDTLKALKAKGKRLMVVTSKPQEMADRVVENVGVAEFFDAVVGPGREMLSPSKTDLINKALKLAGSDGKDAVMVGDRKFDIEGANGAGIDSVGVLYGYGSREELETAGSTYIVDTPAQILDVV
ncbi:phosphoglycolate phosphatase [Oscillospiraceae bacterium]|nr:phosphoglycolate phosphatase [Oscillospiraceae bacterium]